MNEKLAKIALPLFILWPFGSFLCALQNIKLKSSAFIIILFCMVFGYGFSFTNSSADSYRIAFVFSVFNFSSFSEIIGLYKAGGSVDIYRFLMYGITKLFTNNPKILYALCGLVFGVFMYLSLVMFSKEKDNKNEHYITILFILFFSLNPLTNLNGFRFWTATWVFFYAGMNFCIYNKKSWIIGVLITPFIHFSFLFIVPLALAFFFLKKFIYSQQTIASWVLLLFVATFVLSWFLKINSINLGFLTENDLLNYSINNKVSIYNSDRLTDMIQERETSFFHAVSRIFANILKIYIFLFILKVRKIIINNPDERSFKLLAFVMVFASFGYVASIIPSGGRFQIIAYLAAILLFLRVYVQSPSEQLRPFILLGLPAFSFQILFNIGYLAYTVVSSTIWYGNLFWIIYEGIGFKIRYSL